MNGKIHLALKVPRFSLEQMITLIITNKTNATKYDKNKL